MIRFLVCLLILSSFSSTLCTLVAQYTFDEGSGTMIHDSTIYHNNGLINGVANFTKLGPPYIYTNALSFNGSGFVSISSTILSTAQSFTVATWANLDHSYSTTNFYTMLSVDGSVNSGFFLQYCGTCGSWAFVYSNASRATMNESPSSSMWYHLAGVFDLPSLTARLYVNGSLQSTVSFESNTVTNSNGDFIIGGAKWSGNRVDYFKGQIAGSQYYNVSLNATQIMKIYSLSAPIANPNAIYTFTEGGGPTVYDTSGNNYNGVIVGKYGSYVAPGPQQNPYALSLNGSAYVEIDHPILNTTNSYTITAWVSLSNNFNTAGYYTAVSTDSASSDSSVFYLQYCGVCASLAFSFVGNRASMTVSPSTSTWYFMAGVYDSLQQTITLYINGVLQSTITGLVSDPSTGKFFIGAAKFSGNRTDWFNGLIGDVRFFNSTLSVMQITQIYLEVGFVPYPTPPPPTPTPTITTTSTTIPTTTHIATTTSTTAPTTTSTTAPTTTQIATTTSTTTSTTTHIATTTSTTAPTTTSTTAPTTTQIAITTSTTTPTTAQIAITTSTSTPTSTLQPKVTQTPTSNSTQSPTLIHTTSSQIPTSTQFVTPTTTSALTMIPSTNPVPSGSIQFETSFSNLNSTLAEFLTSTGPIPGGDGLPLTMTILSSSNNDTFLALSSNFSTSGVTTRRALRSKGSFGFVNQTAFVDFSIDNSTTSGNIVELWMWVSQSRFLRGSLDISQSLTSRFLSLAYNSSDVDAAVIVQSNCSFQARINYHLEINIVGKWNARVELFQDNSIVCSVSIPLSPFTPDVFFSQKFTLVLSQSSNTLSRKLKQSTTDFMMLYVSKMGVVCQNNIQCSNTGFISSPSTVPTYSSPGSSLVFLVVFVILSAVLVIASIIILIGIVTFVVYKRRKRSIYVQELYEKEYEASGSEVLSVD